MRDAPNAMGYATLGGATEACHVSRSGESAEGAPLSPLAARVVERLGLSHSALRRAEAAALANGTDLGQELVAARIVGEAALTAAMAEVLGLPAERLPDDEAWIDGRSGASHLPIVRTVGPGLEPKLYVAPGLGDLAAVERTLRRSAAARARMRLATPGDIRRRQAAETVEERSAAARLSLSAERPDLSARQVLTGAQGASLAAAAVLLALLAYHVPSPLLLALHLASTGIFLAPTGLRLAAAFAALAARRAPPAPPKLKVPEPARPVYSVLVALRREEAVVRHLVGSLAALRWPRSRLEVFLICEADDPETIAAARAAIRDEPGFEVIVAPVSLPRTKPKALNFALPLATGEFVVLYDAEDRPDPGQLEAAWQAFRTGGEDLACLQAELVIANGRESHLSGLFALEYAGLFGAVLPWLAARRLPLPLGGTSNHFRRHHLVAGGAWDSHNVTEDADLGIRLCRQGYSVGTLRSRTIEDAPVRWRVWHDQRTRWMKGWMQTYLVHMRDPAALRRDLGWRGFTAFQILFIGMIASAIAHPLFLYLVGRALGLLASGRPPDPWTGALMALDLLNVLGGGLAALLLAVATVQGPDRRLLLRRLVWLHPYWLLVSFSAARALVELYRRPHHWAKTPHALPFVAEEATASGETRHVAPT